MLPAGYAELLVHHGVEHLPLLGWQVVGVDESMA